MDRPVERRDNGIDAERYQPLTDVEPDEADELMADLRAEGVAAYAAPMDGADPVPGMERLWVDAAATREARRVLRDFRRRQWDDAEDGDEAEDEGGADDPGGGDGTAGHGGIGAPGDTAETAETGGGAPATPARPAGSRPPAHGPAAVPEAGPAGGGAESEDDVWARIVASFDTDVADEPRRWPAAEELGGPPGAARRPAGDGRFTIGTPGRGPRDWKPATDEEVARSRSGTPEELDEDPEEHFVPPTPPPLPRTDAATKAAWLALLGGPLFLLVSVLMGRQVGPWSTFFAFAAFTGGFVALVARLRHERDEDDPDDGAVV